MADSSTVVLNEEHAPHPSALEAFGQVEHHIKFELVKLRHQWNKHEPRMFQRAPVDTVSDEKLADWDLKKDLVSIRSGPTSYGTILIGKLRLPAVHDAQGEGFIHVRVHDPPTRGTQDVTFHSILTSEVREDDKVVEWSAIQTKDKALEFFNE
ncbi:hypothetical protein RQP46_009947 [Phenoliferia psychrophenolica]